MQDTYSLVTYHTLHSIYWRSGSEIILFILDSFEGIRRRCLDIVIVLIKLDLLLL
jgi:hypothetical protein